MKKLLLLILVLSGLGLQAQYEQEAIEEVVLEAMINGAYNEGIIRNMELGFSDEFTTYITDENGNLRTFSLQEWINQVEQKQQTGTYPLPQEEKVSVRYLRFDIAHNIAYVKLNFLKGNKPQHEEFMVLVHSPTGWLILSRYYQEQAD